MNEADKMFEELGYEKLPFDTFGENITYESDDTVIDFRLAIQYVGISNIVSARELKAINKKCEELGWE